MTKLSLRLLALLAALAVLPAARAAADPGALTQPAGAAGCVSETGDGGSCVDGYGLVDAAALAISPDGRNVYVVAPASQTLAVFARDAATGALTERGCLTLWAQGDPRCAKVAGGLTEPVAVTVSGDGHDVYVANLMDEVTLFRRDTQTGALSQSPGRACIASWSLAGCPLPGMALSAATDVAVSPDGHDVYVSAVGDRAVAELARDDASGLLTQPAGRAPCISHGGSASSATGKPADCVFTPDAFSHPMALAIEPDGRQLLAVDTGARALWQFARDPAKGTLASPSCYASAAQTCGGGAATIHGMQTPSDVAVSADGAQAYVTSSSPGGIAVLTRGAAGGLVQAAEGARYACVTNDGGDGCVQGRALLGADAVAVAPDGRDVYVAALDSGAISTFARDATGGGIRQLGCVSYDGSGGVCVAGRLLEGVHSLAVSPDGLDVYAVSQNHGAVLTLTREQPPAAAQAAPAVAPVAIPASGSVAATPAPRLTGFSASRSGTRFTLTLSAPATVRIAIARRGGHRTLRTLTARLGAGRHTVRLRGRRPAAGRYVATAVATDAAGRRGPARTAAFRVLSGARPRDISA